MNAREPIRARHHYAVSTDHPIVRFERDGFARYLTLRGARAFRFSPGCDTCAFLFERLESERVSPGEGRYTMTERCMDLGYRHTARPASVSSSMVERD
jgi:hypothetical protein